MARRPSDVWRKQVEEEAAKRAQGALSQEETYASALWPESLVASTDAALAAFENELHELISPSDEDVFGAVQYAVLALNKINEQHIRAGQLGYGSDQKRARYTLVVAETSVNAPPTNHAAGSHRRERNRPVGNSRNTKASMAKAISQIQLPSQANTWPAGKDPGAATRAYSPYCPEKALSPSARPATRNSQPMRLAGRRGSKDKANDRDGQAHYFPNDIREIPIRQASGQQMAVHICQRQPAKPQRHRGRRGTASHRPGC
jgi:hypothetical protein